ncbi:MAG: hypothetical protein KKA79_07590 [Nanoarchaeota archaeon]|nr:hypothetical protein [Nanoarchaeota archaeon]
MDRQSAIRLLDETFNTDFDLNRFIRLTRELPQRTQESKETGKQKIL